LVSFKVTKRARPVLTTILQGGFRTQNLLVSFASRGLMKKKKPKGGQLGGIKHHGRRDDGGQTNRGGPPF